MKIVKGISILIISLLVIFTAFVYLANYHPAEEEVMEVTCPENTPSLKTGQDVKVLSWNIQYMAGKNYVFFYDYLDGSGPDERPSPEDIALTIDEVARVINEENPDIIHIQEFDDGSKRTDFDDQMQLLLNRISTDYGCYADAFYHKSMFVPHPRIMGAVGLKLGTIAKYKIDSALRYQLEKIPADPVTMQFNLKRAILETVFPVVDNAGNDAKPLYTYNTHLDAFAQGTNTMQLQIEETIEILNERESAGNPWFISGDFNLLPPGKSFDRLPEQERVYFQPVSELTKLYELYPAIPTQAMTDGDSHATWYTHYPNGTRAEGPDRTIDFFFYSPKLSMSNPRVRMADTLKISDHLPMLINFKL